MAVNGPNLGAEIDAAAAARRVAPAPLDRLQAILLHDLAHGLAARDEPAARHARALAAWYGTCSGAPGGASTAGVSGAVWGSGGGQAGLLGGVFANTTLLAASLQEDFWGALHAGPVLIPPIMALAAARGVGGDRIVCALAGGYRVALAAAALWGPATGARGFRATGLYGQLGAAAACGIMLELDAAALRGAMGHAAATASGTAHGLLAGTAEWQFQAAHAAVEGLKAALLAESGAPASPDAMDGPAGFAAAFAGAAPGPAGLPPQPEPASLLHVGLKRYPVNVLAMSAVEAALAARAAGPLPGPVTAALLEVPAAEAASVGRRGPFDRPMQAVLSAPACVALALIYGELRRETLAAANEPAVAQLAASIELRGAEDLPPMSARLYMQGPGWERRTAAMDPVALYRPPFAICRDRLLNHPPANLAATPAAELADAVSGVEQDPRPLLAMLART